ncbi:MAG: hypothetical protein QGH73_04740 [Rhodospirillales bacterium]|nr:hypothetical protein [Rhodospirillales bacterium]MDP6646565.1 hypothetical protein [Rhodospirillales bacterium]MDP6840963.1 hypothetical protein [Rhodospirillales bacterium]|tara:strand:+ start:648 stop:980 length:333 start_codon:yes stop_codon:yes gene_type:complete
MLVLGSLAGKAQTPCVQIQGFNCNLNFPGILLFFIRSSPPGEISDGEKEQTQESSKKDGEKDRPAPIGQWRRNHRCPQRSHEIGIPLGVSETRALIVTHSLKKEAGQIPS